MRSPFEFFQIRMYLTAVLQTRLSLAGCATSPTSGDVLATAACSSCSGGRASCRGSIGSTALSRGRAHCSQAAVSPQGCGTRAPIMVEAKPNARWSLDFVYDRCANDRRFRILSIVDDVPE